MADIGVIFVVIFVVLAATVLTIFVVAGRYQSAIWDKAVARYPVGDLPGNMRTNVFGTLGSGTCSFRVGWNEDGITLALTRGAILLPWDEVDLEYGMFKGCVHTRMTPKDVPELIVSVALCVEPELHPSEGPNTPLVTETVIPFVGVVWCISLPLFMIMHAAATHDMEGDFYKQWEPVIDMALPVYVVLMAVVVVAMVMLAFYANHVSANSAERELRRLEDAGKKTSVPYLNLR